MTELDERLQLFARTQWDQPALQCEVPIQLRCAMEDTGVDEPKLLARLHLHPGWQHRDAEWLHAALHAEESALTLVEARSIARALGYTWEVALKPSLPWERMWRETIDAEGREAQP